MEPKRVMKLDIPLVIETYQRMLREAPSGHVSAKALTYEISKQIISAKTGKPFTRQALYFILNRSVRAHPETHVRDLPIVCMNVNYVMLSTWLADHIQPALIYGFFDCTPEVARGRVVYGMPSIAAMMAAKLVYWPYHQRAPIFTDVDPTQFGDELVFLPLICVSPRSRKLEKF